MTPQELKAARQSLGLTQQQLADQLGVTKMEPIGQRGPPTRSRDPYAMHADGSGVAAKRSHYPPYWDGAAPSGAHRLLPTL